MVPGKTLFVLIGLLHARIRFLNIVLFKFVFLELVKVLFKLLFIRFEGRLEKLDFFADMSPI